MATQALQQYHGNDDREFNALRAVKDVIAPKTDDAELRVFLAACKRTGLDPFARQIYAIKRGDKLTIQTSIDGYRAIAERSGKYGGQTAPQWCGDDGVWVDVWLKKGNPAAARVGVVRTDWREIVWGIARFDAYKQESNSIWQKMPDVMIAKCFDESTEVLTDRGFQRFAEVTGRVLQVTDSGLEPTDAKPFVQDYEGPMITLDSDDLNFCVTPNHDMVTTGGKIEARHLYSRARSRALFWIPRIVKGGHPEWARVTDSEIVLTAAYLADGQDDSGATFSIELSRPRKIAALRALEISCREYVRATAGSTVQTATRTIVTQQDKTGFTYAWEHVDWLCEKSKQIKFDQLLHLSREQARVFVDALLEFDGHKQQKTGVRRFYTSRPDHLAAFELACVIAGYSVNKPTARTSDISTKPNYFVTVSRRDEIPVRRWGRDYHNLDGDHGGKRVLNGLKLTQNTSGRVWCVTVPSGTIIVRRNGFSMLCGNCAEALALRKAFPQQMGGVYTREEMEQAEYEQPEPAIETTATIAPVTDETPITYTEDPSDGIDMTVQQFLKRAKSELDLDAKAVMAKLGVRTLMGMNLNQAFAQLKPVSLEGLPVSGMH